MSQGAFLYELFNPGGQFEKRMPRVLPQLLALGVNDMGQCIDAHHINGAIAGALGPADTRAGQRIYSVKAQAKPLGMFHCGQ